MKQGHEDGITPAIGHPLEDLTRGTTTNLGQELSAIRIQIAEVPLMGSQLAENASLATSLLMDPVLSPEAPCPSHLRVDQLFEAVASSRPSSWARLSALSKGSTRVYVLSCARPRAELTSRTIRSGDGKTSLSVRNRSRARRKRTFGASCSRARSTS